MKVNKQLMEKARFERKAISELTVAEFRRLMQECFDADRAEVQRRKDDEFARRHSYAEYIQSSVTTATTDAPKLSST